MTVRFDLARAIAGALTIVLASYLRYDRRYDEPIGQQEDL